MSYLKPLLFSLIATTVLSACQVESQKSVLKSPLRDRMATQAKNSSELVDYPQIKPHSFYQLRTPQQQNKYIFDKVEVYLQDQLIRSQDFSHGFYLQQLKKLPPSLARSYATYYLEKELKIDGFEGYFRRCNGFLLSQAIQGYQAMGLKTQGQILQAAAHIFAKPKTPLAKLKQNARKLDQLWAGREDKIQVSRADYFGQEIQNWALIEM
ncbi:MAG: hypothetical protein AB7I41_18970 [Candidatus Sericytochromatia bacterium]